MYLAVRNDSNQYITKLQIFSVSSVPSFTRKIQRNRCSPCTWVVNGKNLTSFTYSNFARTSFTIFNIIIRKFFVQAGFFGGCVLKAAAKQGAFKQEKKVEVFYSNKLLYFGIKCIMIKISKDCLRYKRGTLYGKTFEFRWLSYKNISN